ncbi:hypothetical protein DYD21_01550 [Rhodohalobacter sp. SW132]|uniref:flagellar biosynthesis protein FlhF n=1 Tax=Rhodohalobacter sp. SW132 TaxID=2293433 RepID=UPI000E25B687|nr:hypothetical protein [Rhodohalobacter sp. SW132]REL38661.1 hypothetical protein DYD21_01550 [Rhodohalobacter sp. SW132]
MILKKFLGKTIDAAKKSAQLMYGDDFVILDSNSDDSKGNAGITVAVGKKENANEEQNPNDRHQSASREQKQNGNGVSFERTLDQAAESSVSKNLENLRRYAEKNAPLNGKNIGSDEEDSESENRSEKKSEKTAFTPGGSKPGKLQQNGQGVYSRANVRSSFSQNTQNNRSDDSRKEIPETEESSAPRQTFTPTPAAESRKPEENSLLSKFDKSGPKINRTTNTSTVPSSKPRREEREITALHKRFDKLEALLDSSLISSNLDYASHPAFQQLVQTGISTSVVAGWFSEIIKEGIDPYDQTTIFMSKLSGIIREAIRCETDRKTQKYLLFAGPSGSGKTHLIMKLTQHPDFMKQKKIAVVSMAQSSPDMPYYTILEPFCRDHDIPFYSVTTGVDVTEMQEEWEEYDHILIDTPSISTQQENSFRRYWKMRQVFASVKPLEVHYVVNASLNKFYFKESSAVNHPLQPDYIAITHLDEVSQWGPIIPFMKEMGCPSRYVSNGETLPDSLHRFDPTWFAQNVLKN